ncbi:hypothetical protein AZH53_00100 [Methanomicrobiaceae archaeon CYW5]|nr:hypothetical protein [Methanovulcanius yangii]
MAGNRLRTNKEVDYEEQHEDQNQDRENLEDDPDECPDGFTEDPVIPECQDEVACNGNSRKIMGNAGCPSRLRTGAVVFHPVSLRGLFLHPFMPPPLSG